MKKWRNMILVGKKGDKRWNFLDFWAEPELDPEPLFTQTDPYQNEMIRKGGFILFDCFPG